MESIYLDVTMSITSIDIQIRAAFRETPFVQGDTSKLSDWRVLIDNPQGNGKAGRLRPLKRKKGGENIGFHDLYK